ncbi:hypothetical protein PR003_g29814 [Phytophthora rubi]|uniref:RxLR effector protein n=1 Tax=Phytophthora rubi TaxID=129364 RepID=A0A6A4BET0_9STRA|nr:hypothetical protein PR003_g29814 [Phytophthora rubi]
MVLSVKKTLALALCASTLAACGVSALRPDPRRALSGIHHTTKYGAATQGRARRATTRSPTCDMDGSDSADVSLEGS